MSQPPAQAGNFQAMSGGAPSGDVYGQKQGGLQAGSGTQGQSGKSVADGAVGYYADPNGGQAYVVYADGSVAPLEGTVYDYGYIGGKEYQGEDLNALRNAGVQELTAGEMAQAQIISKGLGLSTAGNMYQDQFNRLAATDVTQDLRRAQRQQLGQVADQRGRATQDALRAQRAMGLTGAFGSDVGGIGAQFAQAAGNVNIQAQQAIEQAEAEKEREMFELRQQARDETERGIQKNVDVATGALNSLDLSAQNMSAETGKKYAVNPNLRSELNTLVSLAQTRNINSSEFARLVAETTARYGSGTYILIDENMSDPLGGAAAKLY
jgi:prepilin-type processing-associated H-X9-DG protein